MPLFLRLLRAQQSATRAVIALPCTTPRTDRSSSVFSEMLTAGLYLELLSMKREGGDPPSFMWRRRRRRGEKWIRRLLRNRRGVQCVLPGAASPPPPSWFFFGGLYESWMCLDERRVFFSRADLKQSSRYRRQTLCLEVCCCCDVQGHSDGEGMSLVLASLSSAFYTCDSKILWYKEKNVLWVVCVQFRGPFWPPTPPVLGSRKTLQKVYGWLFYSLL